MVCLKERMSINLIVFFKGIGRTDGIMTMACCYFWMAAATGVSFWMVWLMAKVRKREWMAPFGEVFG